MRFKCFVRSYKNHVAQVIENKQDKVTKREHLGGLARFPLFAGGDLYLQKQLR